MADRRHIVGIGKLVQLMRKERNRDWSQLDLARKLDDFGVPLTVNQVADLEKFGDFCDSTTHLAALASIFGMSIPELRFQGLKLAVFEVAHQFSHSRQNGQEQTKLIRGRIKGWLEPFQPKYASEAVFREMPNFLDLVEQINGDLLLEDAREEKSDTLTAPQLVGRCGHCQALILDEDGEYCPECFKAWDRDL